MKEYKISCENAEVKAEAIKLFEVLGYHKFHTRDQLLDLVVFTTGRIQSVISGYCEKHPAKQITIEKLRKMAKPIECLVKTDSGWECKVLPKSLIGDAVKIPKKANFATLGMDGFPIFYQTAKSKTFWTGRLGWVKDGFGLCGRTPIWQRTVKSKFIVRTKFGYEVQELPKDTAVTWYCIPLVDGVSESDQIGFYKLCDKVEAVDFDGAKWMRENIGSYYHLVEGCFIWDDTPQGVYYWNLVSKLIK